MGSVESYVSEKRKIEMGEFRADLDETTAKASNYTIVS